MQSFSCSAGWTLLGLLLTTMSLAAAEESPASPVEKQAGQRCEEVRRFPAAEAHQGAAVDRDHFYAISNKEIGKYHKQSGERMAGWKADAGHPLIHLNSGVVIDGKLYCAHTNSPGVPATSSIEIWDVETMQHVESFSFGIAEGALTWIDFHEGHWWGVFATYSLSSLLGSTPDVRWTTLVRFGEKWRREQAWVFPEAVLDRFKPMSNSGGSWGPDGKLYCTGHDHGELYVLTIPKAGSVLRLLETVPAPFMGQGIAWDRSSGGGLWGIDRKRREVVSGRIAK